jgi:hypothetical protein
MLSNNEIEFEKRRGRAIVGADYEGLNIHTKQNWGDVRYVNYI